MISTIKYWFNWVAVLPISIIAAVLITFPIHWILYFTLTGGPIPFITPYPELPERIIQPFFSAAVFVRVASLIAPKFKFITAIIFSTLWIFISGGSFVLGYLGYKYNYTQLNLSVGGLPVFFGVFGAAAGLYSISKELSEETKNSI